MPGAGWNGVRFPQWCISQEKNPERCKHPATHGQCWNREWHRFPHRLVNYGHLEPGASQVFHLAKNPPSFQISVDRLKIPIKHLVIEGKTKIPYWFTSAIIILPSLSYNIFQLYPIMPSLSYSICHHYMIIIYRRHHLTSKVPAQHVVAAKRLGSQDDAEGLLGSQHQLSHVHTIFGLGEGLDPGWPRAALIVESPEATYTSNVDVWYIHR